MEQQSTQQQVVEQFIFTMIFDSNINLYMLNNILFLTFLLPIFPLTGFRKDLYRKDSSIQQFTQSLTSYPNVTKKQCANDDSYHYLQMGDVKKTAFCCIIICNIHARQLITSQICIEWGKRFLQNKYNQLEKISIKLFYRGNNMRDEVFGNNPYQRTNKNNVDLNRNFPTQFNYYYYGLGHPLYGGKEPFDQPFTRCLQDTIQVRKPDIFLDIHSGEDGGLFYQQGRNNQQQLSILKEINEFFCDHECRITTLRKDGQAINGHIFADLKVRLKVPVSFLFQVYSGGNPSQILKYFNPSLQGLKQKIIEKWSDIIDYVIDYYIEQ